VVVANARAIADISQMIAAIDCNGNRRRSIRWSGVGWGD